MLLILFWTESIFESLTTEYSILTICHTYKISEKNIVSGMLEIETATLYISNICAYIYKHAFAAFI